jgi:hypothetical protein
MVRAALKIRLLLPMSARRKSTNTRYYVNYRGIERQQHSLALHVAQVRVARARVKWDDGG